MTDAGRVRRIWIDGTCEHLTRLANVEPATVDRAKRLACAARVYTIKRQGSWPFMQGYGKFALTVRDFHTALEVLVNRDSMNNTKLTWLTIRRMNKLDDWTRDAQSANSDVDPDWVKVEQNGGTEAGPSNARAK